MAKYIEGSCFCGKLKFHYDLPTRYVAHCHCTDCRHAHGAGFVTWAGINVEQFHLDNDSTLKWYGQIETGRRGFCNECGSTLLFESKAWGGDMAITRANLQKDIDVEPSQHGFYDHRAHWIPTISDDLEQLTAANSFPDS
jgi:hypothetical protein